ncbi:MAG: cell division protein FtsQ/DivIB [Janthinobacterium lividum]
MQAISLRPGSGMRKVKDYSGTGSAAAVAEEPAALRPDALREIRRPMTDPLRPRRELVDDFADDADTEAFLRASGRNRRIRRGLIPQTRNGWIAAGLVTLAALGALAAGLTVVTRYLTTSPTFRIPSSQSITVVGNAHLTRAQMLSVFGEDVDRNIFHVPMEQRRAQLEAMPWVEHATLMRLLPNRLRVEVVERVPIAFVRQGGSIGLADANGVLLDIPPDTPGNAGYSFPVVTGLTPQQSPAERAERMKLYSNFMKDLDSDGKGVSAQLSEIDLSDPEDVKALIPDHNIEVQVHFGTENFLARLHKFQEHLVEWRTQYPRLSSVDMRYERQVVLQMPPKDATVSGVTPEAGGAPAHAAAAVAHTAGRAKAFAKAAPPKRVTPQRRAVARSTPAKDAAMKKRVEAIKLWIAKRDRLRAAQGSH